MVENRRLYREKFDTASRYPEARRWTSSMPDAAFYLWARTPMPDTEFTRRLYEAQAVSVLPGSYLAREAHGINPGHEPRAHRARGSTEECAEAARRIRDFARTNARAEKPTRNIDARTEQRCEQLQKIIDAAWEERASITPDEREAGGPRRGARDDRAARQRASCASPRRPAASGSRTSGRRKRCCCRSGSQDNDVLADGYSRYYDKVPSKFAGYDARDVPGRRAFASCRRRRCATAPTSRRTSCSCRRS